MGDNEVFSWMEPLWCVPPHSLMQSSSLVQLIHFSISALILFSLWCCGAYQLFSQAVRRRARVRRAPRVGDRGGVRASLRILAARLPHFLTPSNAPAAHQVRFISISAPIRVTTAAIQPAGQVASPRASTSAMSGSMEEIPLHDVPSTSASAFRPVTPAPYPCAMLPRTPTRHYVARGQRPASVGETSVLCHSPTR
jgi:hypothetical protein